jgi:hypothetical protein
MLEYIQLRQYKKMATAKNIRFMCYDVLLYAEWITENTK